MTMLELFSLPKVILIPTEILHFKWNGYIPVPFEDARFRKPGRIIIEAHFLLMVVPLKTTATSLGKPH